MGDLIKNSKRILENMTQQISTMTRSFFSAPGPSEPKILYYPVWMQYVVVFLLVAMSGNTMVFQHGHPRTAIFIVTLILATLLFRQDGNSISARFGIACACFWAIFVYQTFTFSFFPASTIGGFFVRLFLAYTICSIVRDFPRLYINILFWLGVISLCFFLPEQTLRANGIEIRELFAPFRTMHLGIYQFDVLDRNGGMFWEPGAFGGYLLLAIIFLGLNQKHFQPRSFWIRFFILTATLFTTYSTSVYISFPFAMLVFFKMDKNKTKSIMSFAFIYILAISAEVGVYCVKYYETEEQVQQKVANVDEDLYLSNIDTDFIFKKLKTQSRTAFKDGPGRYHNRFDDIVKDLEYIKKRPVLGWGLNDKTRYSFHVGEEYGSGHGEGLTDWLCKVGFAGLAMFSLCVLRSFIEISNGRFTMSLIATATVILILNGECFLSHPLFMSLMFIKGINPVAKDGTLIPSVSTGCANLER